MFVVFSITVKDGDQESLPTTILEAMTSDVLLIASKYVMIIGFKQRSTKIF